MAVKNPGVWGIDLGQCAVKAIRLEMQNGRIIATAFDYIEHPKILSQPDADPEQLTREALEKLMERNQFKGDEVAISVPGQSGLARFVKLPPVEEKKIGDIVRFEAKQQIPFPLDEVVWDFQKLGGGAVTDGFALETEIGLFAMKREMVHRHLDYFKEARVEVHVVQMAPLALVNFVARDLLNKGAATDEPADGEKPAKNCVVALDIGADNTNLVITDGERIIWQRPIPIGGNHFTRALTKDLKLTFAKAEHLKRNAVRSPDLKKILTSLRPVLNDFVNEAQRSLGYFTNTHRDASILYMIGLGNAFRLPGLQKFLQEKLQLEVRKLSKFNRLAGEQVTAAPQFADNVMSFGVAYGLALQGLKQTRLHTNLLPKEIQTERMIKAKKPWALATAAAMLLTVGALLTASSCDYAPLADSGITAAFADGNSAIAQANTLSKQYKDKNEEAKTSKEAAERIAAGVDMRYNWNLLFQYINDALPRPDGTGLSTSTSRGVDSKDKYWNPPPGKLETFKGEAAYQNYLARQSLIARGEAADPTMEEAIKKELVSINIDGISSRFVESPAELLNNLDKHILAGMKIEDEGRVKKGAEAWPKNPGWIIEVRGYTYHQDAQKFVINTFLENLVKPQGVAVGKQLKEKDKAELKKNIEDRVSFVFLYKAEKYENPQPGELGLVRKSLLSEALKPKAGGPPAGGAEAGGAEAQPAAVKKGPGRETWKPLGTVAAATLTGGGVGDVRPPVQPVVPPKTEDGKPLPKPVDRQPRFEFHLMFFWEEPLPSEPGAIAVADPVPAGHAAKGKDN